MDFNDIAPELREKAKNCKTAEELIELAKDEGLELSDEQIEAISGGAWNCWDDCAEVTYGANNSPCPGVIY